MRAAAAGAHASIHALRLTWCFPCAEEPLPLTPLEPAQNNADVAARAGALWERLVDGVMAHTSVAPRRAAPGVATE